LKSSVESNSRTGKGLLAQATTGKDKLVVKKLFAT
jgi:hypothetical protein